jgi:hypothetical protein
MSDAYFYKNVTNAHWATANNWWTTSAHNVALGRIPVADDAVYLIGETAPDTGPAVAIKFLRFDSTGLAAALAASFSTNITIESTGWPLGNLSIGNLLGYNHEWGGTAVQSGTSITFVTGTNYGTVGELATLNNHSANYGTVGNSATFNNSDNYGGTVGDYSTFNNIGNTVIYGTIGNHCVFNADCYLESAVVGAYATFNDHTQISNGSVGDNWRWNSDGAIYEVTWGVSLAANQAAILLATQLAIKAKTDLITFAGGRVLSTGSSVGGLCGSVFLFDLIVSPAEPLVITAASSSYEDTQELDVIHRVTTHVDATIGTQWQITKDVVNHDPAWTEMIGDPEITLSSSDESVATVDASGFVHFVGNGTCKIIGISEAIGTSPSRRVEVAVVNATSIATPVLTTVDMPVAGSVRKKATDNVDDRLAGKEKLIFTTQDHWATPPVYVRNPNCWAADLDLTCISPWNSSGGVRMAGTLISPRHIIFAAHYQIAVGATVRFVDGSNNVVSRTLTAIVNLSNNVDHLPDFVIGLLDSNVTGCGFAKVLPDDWADYLPNSGIKIPALALDQEEKALVTDTWYLSEPVGGIAFQVPTSEVRLSFYEAIIPGDSGNPAFFIINDELVILAVWTLGGPGAGFAVHAFVPQIEAAMVSLGGGYNTLTRINLSGFNTY